MFTYTLRRLLAVIPLVLVISMISFGIYQLSPGDPVKGFIPREAAGDPAEVERIRAMLGLDQPPHVQYAKWLTQVAQGNFGRSAIDNEPVRFN
jgi:peptide/nickel transport system permease protein